MRTKLVKGLLICVSLFLLAVSSTQSHSVQAQGGSGWTKYAENPVLSVGAPGTWDDEGLMNPCVIKDGSTYKMWYCGYDGTRRRIGYATSSDGITWTKSGSNPVLDVGSAGSWDDEEVTQPWVIREDATTYRVWYMGSDGITWKIGFARSGNGISWTREGAVLSQGASGQPDDEGILHPTVIKEGSSYIMWYAASGEGSRWDVCMAHSGDGLTWSKYDGSFGGSIDIVLHRGSSGSWDDYWAHEPSVMKSGDVYFMWYLGYDNEGGGHYQTGLAYSTTGTSWTKYTGNPVLSIGAPGAWDDYGVGSVCVVQDRLDFKMWYTGDSDSGLGSRRIGYATNFMRVGGGMGLIDAPESTVYYIYPDSEGTKPAGTFHASVSDWTALGIVLGMSNSKQYVTTDTHTSVVRTSDGALVVGASYSAVVCGGKAVSGPTKYYETTAIVTPAYFQLVDSICHFYSRSTGSAIMGTAMSLTDISTNKDMFIIMAFKDADGRSILILYGYGWKGSYAAALWFKYGSTFGRQGIPKLEKAYYICKWTDANSDGFVDLSEISSVASGN